VGVLKSGQPVLCEALAPLADGVAVARQLGGDLLVGRLVVSGGEQDDAGAQRQGLWRGAGAGESLELAAQFICEVNAGAERARHGWTPRGRDRDVGLPLIMAPAPPFG